MRFNTTGSGKGSAQRPSQVSDDVVTENWNRIFGDKEKRNKLLDALAKTS